MTIHVPFKEFIYLPALGLSFSMQNIQSLLKHVGSFSCSVQDLYGEGNGNPCQYSCLESPLGQTSLAGCSPWGAKESDVTEQQSTCRRFSCGMWDLVP